MYQYHTLNNGIRIVFRHNDSPVTHAGVYINVGSRNEAPGQEGMAHFIEHSIFKGTTHRRSCHILNRIDGVGGELNAFTTKEETCVYASALSVHLERCLELFADILFHSQFPEHEIEHEKDVVLEEINSYKDTPSELIFDDFEDLLLAGHPLGHNILGTKHNVRHFSRAQLQEFFHRNYTPDRMVISIVGNADFKRVVHLCQKHFGAYQPSNAATQGKINLKEQQDLVGKAGKNPMSQENYHQFNQTVNRHTHQMHVMLGCGAYNTFHQRKAAFTLLNNLVGGPAMNSRLNAAIRERYGFCYCVESQYTAYSDAGVFCIYAGIEPQALDRYLQLVWRELNHFASQPLSAQQLHAAKQQFVGQMAINNESPLNEMQSIGKSYLSYDRVDSLEEMAREIEAVTAADIQSIAQEIFSPSRFGCLIYR